MPVFKTYKCSHCQHRFASPQTLASHKKRRSELGRCPINQGGYQPKRVTYLQDLQDTGLIKGLGKSDKKDRELVRSVDTEWT